MIKVNIKIKTIDYIQNCRLGYDHKSYSLYHYSLQEVTVYERLQFILNLTLKSTTTTNHNYS